MRVIINEHCFNFLTPEFALERICGDENKYTLFPYMSEIVDHIEQEREKLEEGNALYYRERYYHKYPAYVAVIYDNFDCFSLQTFAHGKVGRLFDDVAKQESEIYKFFMEARGYIIVLDDSRCREIANSFDLLMLYVGKRSEARRIFREHDRETHDIIQELNNTLRDREDYFKKDGDRFFQKLESDLRYSIQSIRDGIREVEKRVGGDLEHVLKNLGQDERDYIAFGLYFHCLKRAKLNGSIVGRMMFSDFLREMHEFIHSRNNIIERYFDHMGFSPYVRFDIRKTLEEEGLTSNRWIFAADDLLDI